MVLLRKNDIGIGLTVSVLLSLFVNFTMLGRIYELGVDNRIVDVRPPDRIVYYLLVWFFLVSFILFIVNRLMLHIGDRLFRKKEYKRIALACAVCLVIGLGLYRLAPTLYDWFIVEWPEAEVASPMEGNPPISVEPPAFAFPPEGPRQPPRPFTGPASFLAEHLFIFLMVILSSILIRLLNIKQQMRLENERLRDFAGLRPSSLDFDPESATVTERSTSNWNSTLTISKGSSMGIAVDDVVVDQYWNLVGVVAEVGENWARVRTLVDVATEMGGQIARTGGAAILEGDFALMGEGKLKLTYLPENSELMSGDLITTSGRGGVYPPGLAAGHVEEVRTDPSGMTRYAVLIPETDLAGLQQVFVIKDFEVVE